MNRITIIGNLTRDPETGTTQSGYNYCRFDVAVNRRKRQDGTQDAEFFQVTAWSGLAASCGQYLQKGKKVAVVGEARAYGWIRKDGSGAGARIEITAQEVEFLSSGGNGQSAPPEEPDWLKNGNGGNAGEGAVDPETGMQAVDPDDVPF